MAASLVVVLLNQPVLEPMDPRFTWEAAESAAVAMLRRLAVGNLMAAVLYYAGAYIVLGRRSAVGNLRAELATRHWAMKVMSCLVGLFVIGPCVAIGVSLVTTAVAGGSLFDFGFEPWP